MRVDVSPSMLVVPAGRPARFVVTVFNTAPVISAHRVSVLGVDPSWVSVDIDQLSLFPDTAGVVTIDIALPPGVPAGTRRLGVQVRELTAPGRTEVVEVEVTIPAEHGTRLELDPPSVTGGRRATFGLVLLNDGNTDAPLRLTGQDEESKVDFRFAPPDLSVAAGERVAVSAELRARRPLTGSPKVRQFTVQAEGDQDPPAMAVGTFIQRPYLSRGAFALVGLLAAISVFAAVITMTLGRVVDESARDRDLLLEALAGGSERGGIENPGSVAGTVTLLTSGAPVAGVTVEALEIGDLSSPVATAATADDGTYLLEGLDEATYKLRFRGAGFSELWFPQSLGPDQAEEVEVTLGETTEPVDVRLGGLPATLEGVVIGEDPAGATVSLRLPSPLLGGPILAGIGDDPTDPLSAPLVTSVTVDDTGQFRLEGIPSPSVYELAVSKEGFATEIQLVNLGAGEERTGVEIALRRGDGSISGRVLSPTGSLGGAVITASDGQSTIRTVSLTRDDVGAFTLRNVPTPATYTLVVSKEGFVTETLTVTLGVAEQRQGIDVTLGGSAGSISGRVTTGGNPAGGVVVRATDGEIVVETVTLSIGNVGSYRLAGLPVPGTFTVTFQRADLASQTLSVDLDHIGRKDLVNVDATLNSATASIFGTVRELPGPGQDPVGVGEVEITLTSGNRTFRTTSASQPVGAYRIDNLPPGTYSVTFRRPGSQPTATLVTVAAGDQLALDALLQKRASVLGIVQFHNGETVVALEGAQVRLFRAADYPSNPVATIITGNDGSYHFIDLNAPETYIVEFAYPVASTPQTTRIVVPDAGEDVPVEPVVLQVSS